MRHVGLGEVGLAQNGPLCFSARPQVRRLGSVQHAHTTIEIMMAPGVGAITRARQTDVTHPILAVGRPPRAPIVQLLHTYLPMKSRTLCTRAYMQLTREVQTDRPTLKLPDSGACALGPDWTAGKLTSVRHP
jgi:hypothetical protein